MNPFCQIEYVSSDSDVGTPCGKPLLPSLFGGRERGILPKAVLAVHTVLRNDPTIQDVRWHFKLDFDAGREELGVSKPS